MPPDGTTATDPGVTTLPATPAAPPPAVPAPQPQVFGQAEPPPFASSRQLRRSEEHTSELQSRLHLVCRLLLEKKQNTRIGRRKPKGGRRRSGGRPARGG